MCPCYTVFIQEVWHINVQYTNKMMFICPEGPSGQWCFCAVIRQHKIRLNEYGTPLGGNKYVKHL